MRVVALIALLATCSCLTLACRAQDWADLKGRFTFEGKIPQRKILQVSERDKAAVGLPADYKILDESLVIDEKTKGVANILLWIIPDPEKPDAKMPIHPSYPMTTPTEHVVRIKNLAFTPHVSIMRTDAKKLVFLGEDPIAHAANVNSADIPASCRALATGVRDEWKIDKQTKLPAWIHCHIHPHETGFLLVRDNPYFAVTNEKGEFEIKHLPLGQWRFKVWQEKCGWVKEVTLAGKKVAWVKGELDVEIKKEALDLGEIKISEELFSNR